MTLGWPDSITATQEFVVPKSIPTTLERVSGADDLLRERTGVLERGGVGSVSLEQGVEHWQSLSRNQA